jgi:hypothetical protein
LTGILNSTLSLINLKRKFLIYIYEGRKIMNLYKIKKIFLLTFLLNFVLFLSACPFYNTVNESTKVILVSFHSDNCLDCNELKGKLSRMGFKFTLSPIVFIIYDKTTELTKVQSEEKLKGAGIIDEARKDDGLRYAILYNAKTKAKISQIDALESEESIENKIKNALESIM